MPITRDDLLNEDPVRWSTIGQVVDLAELWAAARMRSAPLALRCRAEWVRRRVAPALPAFADEAEAPPGAGVLTTGERGQGAFGCVHLGASGNGPWERIAECVRTWSGSGNEGPAAAFIVDVAAGTHGDSLALAMWLAWIAALYRLPQPAAGDAIATGGLRQDSRAWRFDPVPAETLPAKARAARRLGYRRLLVIEGQPLPDGLDIEVVPVPADPTEALPQVLAALWPQVDWQPLARAFDVLERDLLQRQRPIPYTDMQQLLAPWRSHASPLIRGLADLLCSTAALHQGRSQEAADHHAASVRLLAEARRQRHWPAGRLGDLLDWRMHAHYAIVCLDNGQWEEGQGVWRELPRLIAACAAEAHRPERAYAALCLRNAYARWLEYRARLAGDAAALAESWRLRTAERDDWQRIVAYARDALGERNTTLARQHHECIDTLASWHALHGRLPDLGELPGPHWSELDLWTERWQGVWERLPPYDLVYALRWRALRGTASHADAAAALTAADRHQQDGVRQGRGPWTYPLHQVPEIILRYQLGDAATRERAAQALASACDLFPGPQEPQHTVMALLALRAAALLGPAAPPRAHWISAPPGSPLAQLAERIAPDPVRRAPY